MNGKIYNTIIFFIIIIILIYSIKPNFLYNSSTSSFRSFGFGEDETIFTLPVVAIILALILYFIFTILDLLYKHLD